VQWNPAIEALLHTLNGRIVKGTALLRDTHDNTEVAAYTTTLTAMKRQRRYLNAVYQTQQQLPALLLSPEQALQAIVRSRQLYFQVNDWLPGECQKYHEIERRICATPFGQAVLRMTQAFGLDYDYENLEQFFIDTQALLLAYTQFALHALNALYGIREPKG